jgi:hypothetical protein
MIPTTAFRILVLAGLAAGLLAQDPEPTAASSSPQALLQRAVDKMATLAGVAFKTVEAQDQAITRRFGGALGGGEIEVSGESSAGLVRATMNFDEDEVVRHAGRSIARRGDGEWKPRTGSLAGGQPAPFILDPERFFEILAALPAEQLAAKQQEQTNFKGQELVILSVSLDGPAASELAMTGIVPRLQSPMIQIGGMGGTGDAMPKPEMTTDLAIYVDPQSALIHRIRVKSYERNPMIANMQIHFDGPGGDLDIEDEADKEAEVEETDAQGNRVYQKGLPVRKLDDTTSMLDFDIVFSDHGKSFAPEIGDKGRKLLKLGAK